MRLALVGFGLLLPLLTGAASSPRTSAGGSASAAVFERPRVLIWHMQNAGVKQHVPRAVAASVTRWASRNPHLEVVSHADLANLLKVESTRLHLGLPEENRLQEIAEKANAALVVFGQVSRVGRKMVVNLSLFEAKTARAVHREKVALENLDQLDDDLGRAANALVGRVLESPALDLRGAAADLVDQVPAEFFEAKSAVTTVRPFRYGESRFSSPFGKQAAAEVSGAIRRRAKGKRLTLRRGFRLEGRYEVNHDMVELALVVRQKATPKILFKAQTRVIRGALTAAGLVPAKLALEERRRVEAQASIGAPGDLQIDSWTEKGRVDVVFVEGETFHVYLKMNRTGYVRFIYHFADGKTRVLMEDAWPLGEEQVGTVVRYHQTFGPAPPFGVERIEVLAFEERPPPLETLNKTIGGAEYEVIRTTRGFIKAPQSRSEITITTTGR